MADSPGLRILTRTPDAASLVDVPSPTSTSFGDGPLTDTPAGGAVAWSPDGATLALAGPTGVALLDGDTGAPRPGARPLPVRAPRAIAWSPGGTYIITYARPPNPAKPGEPPVPEAEAKNLALWRAADGARLLAFSHRGAFNPREDGWPLQVAVGEAVAWHLVTNAVNAYELGGGDGGGGGGGGDAALSSPVVARKLPVKGVVGFAPSPDGGRRIAAFVPEAKGAPAWVGVWEVEGLPGSGGGGGAGAAPPAPLARRSFFRANACSLLWAPPLDPSLAASASSKKSGDGGGSEAPPPSTPPLSTALLALASSDADATNQSYYGEQQLHFLAADGSADCLVPLPKAGPIHDVAWSPRGDTFLALAGFMPPKATLFAASGPSLKKGEGAVPVYDLGSGPWSLARWSPPSGRFLALCGFGNLAGDVAFFDRKADGKLKPCGAVRCDNGGLATWAPDGRRLVVATCAPRLRVDNGLRLVKYDGTVLASRPYPVLLEAAVRPAPAGTWPDRPPSPRAGGGGTGGAGARAGAKPPTAAPARPAGYLPPHLRGAGGGSAAAAPAPLGFSLAYDPLEAGPRKIPAGGAGAGRTAGGFARPLPPGAEPAPGETKAASKNAKRRAAAARKKAEEGMAAVTL